MINQQEADELIQKNLRQYQDHWMVRPVSRGFKPVEPCRLNHPASAIGMLIITYPSKGTIYGGGALISTNIVITSAENLYHRDTREQPERIVFMTSTTQGGVYHATKWHYPQQFKEKPDFQRWNVGLIELNENVHLKVGFVGVSFEGKTASEGTIFGYRGDNKRLVHRTVKLNQNPKSLVQLLTPVPFLSGAPILQWNQNKTDIQVIAVSNNKDDYVLLTPQILSSLKYKFSKITSERIVLWDKSLPKTIVHSLVKSKQQWHRRLMTLFIMHQIYGPQSPTVLNIVPWPNLKKLNLYQTNLEDQGVYQLSRGYFPNMQTLYLVNNPFGNEGARFIAKGSWRDLAELYLWATNVTNKIITIILKGGFKYLKTIELNQCKGVNSKLASHKLKAVGPEHLNIKY